MGDPETNGHRLEALRKREQALRALIAAENDRLQKRRARIHARHAAIVGACVLDDLANNPQLAVLLEEILKRHASPQDAPFLKERGWTV